MNDMNTEKDIKSRNEIGRPHGFWEVYFSDGKIIYKRFYHNGRRVGYDEDSDSSGRLDYKAFWLK